MKIRIKKVSEWLKNERHIEVGHEFNVLKKGLSSYRKGRVWFMIGVHNGKPTIVYDDEVEILEQVESSFAADLRRIFKTTIG